MITEDQLEQQCLDWFKELDYQYQNGYDIAPDLVSALVTNCASLHCRLAETRECEGEIG
ncbi:hypothetical protein [Vibrio japonicus]|uniref:Uncharacterized protein n=1 Tax=Vibrio japonicus TaxID=1824638 RepID=A0ABY5LJY6_9VIBR|nr:hypothetical protein [Vibrio japonicus]UUM32369.1 hypothetical protein NP165_19000 [Vibrio japonicus]